jgi:hypothetical protein
VLQLRIQQEFKTIFCQTLTRWQRNVCRTGHIGHSKCHVSDDNFVDRQTLIAQRDPVLARLRCSHQKAARVVDPDGLATAQRLCTALKLMTAPGQFRGNAVGDRLFELKDAAIGKEARNLGRLLRVET